MPPKRLKGKKLAAKLAKMTDEERTLYLEQRALAEEEVKTKKEEMLTQYLKEKLTREQKATAFNMRKINHQWRQILRLIKGTELLKEIEILSHTFERVSDRKENNIQSLVKDITEAEEQHATALRSHVQALDHLIEIHDERLQFLKSNYDDAMYTLNDDYSKEKIQVLVKHEEDMQQMVDILFAMEQNFIDRETIARNEIEGVKDESRNKNLEEKHALRVQLENIIDDVWSQFQQAHQQYIEATEERRKAFEDLKFKDDMTSRDIERQQRKICNMSESIVQTKEKIQAITHENEERNQGLQSEREAMMEHFQKLKLQLSTIRDGDYSKLTKLSVESNATLKELERVRKKAGRILKLAEMCRKLESEREKVLPFYNSTLSKEEESEVKLAMAEPPTLQWTNVMHQYSPLENFWKRYNKVLLDRLALDRDRRDLQIENDHLRMMLKQYLDGLSVSDEILSRANPLFVVNNNRNIKFPSIPVTDPRIARPMKTVVEASHIMKHRVYAQITK